MYKGDSSYPDIPSSAEAAHSALCAFTYRISNDGPHFEVEIVDPQKLTHVASLSRQSNYVCPPALLWLTMLCRDSVLCLFPELCCDIL